MAGKDKKNTLVWDESKHNWPFMKILLVSDVKNPKLWQKIRPAKKAIFNNFHDWWFDVDKINTYFWIYFNENKNIFIPPNLKIFLSKKLFIEDIGNENAPFILKKYVIILNYIRTMMEDFIAKILPLVQLTKNHAKSEIDTDITYSDFSLEQEAADIDTLTKETFDSLYKETFAGDKDSYDIDWFHNISTTISDEWQQNKYKDLIMFAVLGIHYFNQKKIVYDAFSEQQLQELLTFPGWDTLTLSDFLAIIQQLDFKKHFFDL